MQQTLMQQDKENLILNRYEVMEELGSGGFSKVYKCFDTKMERYVAIKVIPASSKATSWAKREAQTSARLNHPGIATIYEYDEIDNNHYLIMEYLEGITLREILESLDYLHPCQAVALAAELAIALEYAHINFVVHRDIKPENVMILKDGRVKLADFGTARLLSEVSSGGKLVATPSYMSPEQAQGKRDDDRTDQFSLGTVLYEMLTGKNPFDAGTTKATLFKVANSKPEPPSSFNKDVSKELDEVCLKALEKDPDERFATVTDFRYKIERSVEKEFSNKKIIKELYGHLKGETYEKAYPELFSSLRNVLRNIFRNEQLTVRMTCGILPALFILLYAVNVTWEAKGLISAGLIGLSAIHPFLGLAFFTGLLVIKAFFTLPLYGLLALVAGVLYLYFHAREHPFEAALPLTAFVVAKMTAIPIFPLITGLLLNLPAAIITAFIGMTALAFHNLTTGKEVLFVTGNNYLALLVQVILFTSLSGVIAIFSKKQSNKNILLIIGSLILVTVVFALPYWSLLEMKVRFSYVMQNISLSLIIMVAIVLLMPLEDLKVR